MFEILLFLKTLIFAFLAITILSGTNVIRATSLVTIIEDIKVINTSAKDIDV